MIKQRIVTIFALLITSNYSFCMEQENNQITLPNCTAKAKDPYQNLKFLLKKHITTTNDIEYNAISPDFQYDILKTCIENDQMERLSLCLEYKFNPNRYRKQLSLLHCAIQHHKPKAITILAQYNPDLVPLNAQGETPLNFAANVQCEECINAMATVIRKKYNQLEIYNKHCGLTKHILNPGPCEECKGELKWQLQCYGLLDPCINKTDLEEVII